MNAIDLFAGAGGFSTGAAAAGCTIVWAANHWRAAVDTHAANHPGTPEYAAIASRRIHGDAPLFAEVASA